MNAPPSPPHAVPDRGALALGGLPDAFLWGLLRVVRWRKVLLVGAVAVGCGILLGVLVRKTAGDEAAEALSELLGPGVIGFGLPVLTLLLASEGFAYEIQAKTLVYHLVRPIRRTTLFVARFLAGWVPAALVSAAALVALILASGVPFTGRAWLMVPAVAGLGSLALAAIYYTLGAIFKNGFVIGLVYTFFVEAALSSIPGSMQQLSVTEHVRTLQRWATEGVLPYVPPTPDNPFFGEKLIRSFTAPPDPVWASVNLLAVAVVVLVVGAWWTARRDFALK